MSREPNLSVVFFKRLQALKRKANSLQQEIANLEAEISQVVVEQQGRILELESWVNPDSNCGEAICNWYSKEDDIYF